MEKITRSDWTLFSLKMKIKRKNLPKTFCSIFWVCKKKKKKSSSLFWTVSSFFGHSFFLSYKLFFPSTLSFLLRFFPHHLAPFFNSPSFWPTNHFFWDLRGEEAKTHCRQRRRRCCRCRQELGSLSRWLYYAIYLAIEVLFSLDFRGCKVCALIFIAPAREK